MRYNNCVKLSVSFLLKFVGEFEMLTFLPFEGYYSFFLKDFKSVLFALNLLKVSSE